MKIQNLSIAMMFMAVLILGLTTFMTDLGDNYGAGDYEGLEYTQDALEFQLNASTSLRTSIQDITLQDNEDSGVLMIPYNLIKAGWNMIKIVFSPFFIIGSLLSDLTSTSSGLGIPLPSWLVTTVIAMMFISLSAILVFAFFKWRFEN